MSHFTKQRARLRAIEQIEAAKTEATHHRAQAGIWRYGAEVLQAELTALRAYMAQHAPMELRCFDVRENE